MKIEILNSFKEVFYKLSTYKDLSLFGNTEEHLILGVNATETHTSLDTLTSREFGIYIGYISYTGDVFFRYYPQYIYYDLNTGEYGGDKIYMEYLEKETPHIEQFKIQKITQDTEEKWHDKITKSLQYIKDGYAYVLNITEQIFVTFSGDIRDFYTKKIAQNIPHYSAYIKEENTTHISLSPELAFTIKNKQITVRPIKGTAKKEDIEALENSEKEKAELNMITDLYRNDLGQICDFHSIATSPRQIKQFGNILQAFTQITGQIKQDTTIIDAIKKLIPMGSITGTPKIESTKIIKEIEQYDRKIYTGVIGYISANLQECEFSVAIRTATLNENKMTVPVGSGITIDSNSKQEREENIMKFENFIKSE